MDEPTRPGRMHHASELQPLHNMIIEALEDGPKTSAEIDTFCRARGSACPAAATRISEIRMIFNMHGIKRDIECRWIRRPGDRRSRPVFHLEDTEENGQRELPFMA